MSIHLDARKGDLEAVKADLLAGTYVDTTDMYGSTPLHVACMYGHTEVAAFLLENGADINSLSYFAHLDPNTYMGNFTCKIVSTLQNYGFDSLSAYFYPSYLYWNGWIAYTPLDLAIKYSPTSEPVSYMLNAGAASIHKGNYLFEDAYFAASNQDYQNLDLILNKIDILSHDYGQTIPSVIGLDSYTLQMHELLTLVDDLEATIQINQTYQHLLQTDSLDITGHYLAAKMLTHAFPSNNIYEYTLGDIHAQMTSGGFYLGYVNQASEKYISRYLHDVIEPNFSADFDETLLLQEMIFTNVHTSFEYASFAEQYPALWETSEFLYDAYSQGVTLVLPCTWNFDGEYHSFNVILDKSTSLYGIANASNNIEVPLGFMAYKTNFDITPQDIYDIINTEDKMQQEFMMHYKLGLEPNPELSFESPIQEFENCAWNSQLLSQQALLLIDLSKNTETPELAQQISKVWFDDYNDFQKTEILKDYIDKPGLSNNALEDVLTNYHSDISSVYDMERVILIHDVLSPNNSDFDTDMKHNLHETANLAPNNTPMQIFYPFIADPLANHSLSETQTG